MLRTMVAAVFLLSVNMGAAAADKRLQELRGEDRSATDLNNDCMAPDPGRRHLCNHVIASTLAVHHVMVANHPELAAYCPDREPSVAETRALFLRWYLHQPDVLPSIILPGAVGVIAALRDRWPCLR
jgi:Rap1a immunity proteins